MLSNSTRNMLVKRSSQLTRSSPKRFQTTIMTSTTAPVKRSKPFSKTRFLFKLSFYTAAIYGIGATVALNYEPFQDFYFEYFPYGEQVMDNVDYAWKHKENLFETDYKNLFNETQNQFSDSVNNVSEKLGLGNLIQVPRKGVQVEPVPVKTTDELNREKDENIIVLLEEQPVEKIIEIKPVEKENKETNIVLPFIKLETSDPEIKQIEDSLNKFISSVNDVNSKDSQKFIDTINFTLQKLTTKYDKLLTEKNVDLQIFKDEELKRLEKKFGDDKKLLTEELTSNLENAKQNLNKKYDEKFKLEIDETEKTLALESQNIILKSQLDTIDEFNKIVAQKIDNERNAKLKDLENLSSRVEAVEKFELELTKSAVTFNTFKEIKKTISNIQSILLLNESSSKSGISLVNEFSKLKELTAPLDNNLINAAITNLPSNTNLLTTGGILTQSQLISRWELLTPELRSVSLLPPNAGLLGHISSWIFSKFLFTKSGVPIKTDNEIIGNDVESVISRVNSYLQKNELDNAVEEVSSLKGVARNLADDWLIESRKKLEVQFLVDLINSEVNVSA